MHAAAGDDPTINAVEELMHAAKQTGFSLYHVGPVNPLSELCGGWQHADACRMYHHAPRMLGLQQMEVLQHSVYTAALHKVDIFDNLAVRGWRHVAVCSGSNVAKLWGILPPCSTL
jgi:hypothetical protein